MVSGLLAFTPSSRTRKEKGRQASRRKEKNSGPGDGSSLKENAQGRSVMKKRISLAKQSTKVEYRLSKIRSLLGPLLKKLGSEGRIFRVWFGEVG